MSKVISSEQGTYFVDVSDTEDKVEIEIVGGNNTGELAGMGVLLVNISVDDKGFVNIKANGDADKCFLDTNLTTKVTQQLQVERVGVITKW